MTACRLVCPFGKGELTKISGRGALPHSEAATPFTAAHRPERFGSARLGSAGSLLAGSVCNCFRPPSQQRSILARLWLLQTADRSPRGRYITMFAQHAPAGVESCGVPQYFPQYTSVRNSCENWGYSANIVIPFQQDSFSSRSLQAGSRQDVLHD